MWSSSEAALSLDSVEQVVSPGICWDVLSPSRQSYEGPQANSSESFASFPMQVISTSCPDVLLYSCVVVRNIAPDYFGPFYPTGSGTGTFS